MIEIRRPKSKLHGFLTLCEVIYHSIARSVRSKHNNAFMALGLNLLQMILFVAAFYVMFSVLNLRSAAVRGDFLLYVMTGIFLFLCHTKAVAAVSKAEGPASPMMQHAPMNTIVALVSAALGSLYVQLLSLLFVLFIYHIAFTPVHIEQPLAALGMLLIAWFSGAAVGLLFYVLTPWWPAGVGVISMVYQRANMFASGKMFLANTMPSFMLAMFDWNPLFHSIDQARGYTFINYNPRYSSWEYAVWVSVVLIMIGLMAEFYTRKNASLSWSARR